MTAVLERIPVDRITAEAKDIRFGAVILTAIAGLLYGVGWTAAKVVAVAVTLFGVLWKALVWCGVAVKVGWQDARKPKAAERATA